MMSTHCRCDAALALADAASDVTLSEGEGLTAAMKILGDALQAFGMTYAQQAACCPLGNDGLPGAILRQAETCATRNDPPPRVAEALAITRPGACNPSGIALAIVEACRQIRAEGGAPAKDAAVRLMASQLAWVCETDTMLAEEY